MDTNERVTVKEAAKILGRSEQYIRLHLRDGTLNVGRAKPPPVGGSVWQYDIYKKSLEAYVGGGMKEQGSVI